MTVFSKLFFITRVRIIDIVLLEEFLLSFRYGTAVVPKALGELPTNSVQAQMFFLVISGN